VHIHDEVREAHGIEDKERKWEESAYHESDAYPFLMMSASVLELPFENILSYLQF
jgi:hypothetical protein